MSKKEEKLMICKKCKKEIADDVLSRISATVDVSEIIEQIEELRRLIDSLGR
jgi:hypothetical protein